jgi:hypothetical protein
MVAVGEVDITWTQLPARFSFCLRSQTLQLKSILNPSERLAQLDLASNMFFLLLMVTSSSTKVSLKAQNATQISRAHTFPSAYGHKLFNESGLEGSKCNPNFQGARFSFYLWSQALQRK